MYLNIEGKMTGELMSLGVAICWTSSAIFFEYSGRVSKSTNLNLIKLVFSFVAIGVILTVMEGSPFPKWVDGKVWLWMSLSGFSGFVFGDYFMFASYRLIPARFTQLIMTVSPLFAALGGFLLLGEKLEPIAILGMFLTLSGIALSILKKGETSDLSARGQHPKMRLSLPLKGVIFSLFAAIGQGLGLVLSKIGMIEYEKCVSWAVSPLYTPLAAVEIRVIFGILCFALIIALSKEGFKDIFKAFSTKRYAATTLGGSITGPLIGVPLSMAAVLYTDAAIASTIIALVPILIIIPDRFVYKRRVTFWEVLGAVISVGGVTLLFL